MVLMTEFEKDEPTPQEVRIQRIVLLVLWSVEALLAFRFILKLLGANPNSAFAFVMYALSTMFVFPFAGLFRAAESAGPEIHSVFEPSTLVAMAVYVVFASLIAKWITLMWENAESERRKKHS